MPQDTQAMTWLVRPFRNDTWLLVAVGRELSLDDEPRATTSIEIPDGTGALSLNTTYFRADGPAYPGVGFRLCAASSTPDLSIAVHDADQELDGTWNRSDRARWLAWAGITVHDPIPDDLIRCSRLRCTIGPAT